ncbi:AAA family ATPase [Spongiibacter sp. KMU-158]|uniref:AAA family ATPase n=1 Tax=Spongiibacter pelagi TaxID=2760804 RepID=A0A927BZ50_9GAMM|nr:AAA family ATPase [Spongiibacter pelagi]MBD2858240.1 AAA family ATPase [Spongiibacter pelagi]
MQKDSTTNKTIQRPSAEVLFQEELAKLKAQDKTAAPPGWQLSPLMVEKFVLGCPELNIERKLVAPQELVTRIIIAMATNQGVMLIGEPGTAKSWLSELLSTAISGDSSLTVQGGAISHYQQLLYDWNPVLSQTLGPCRESLIPGPVFRAMESGQLLRFEELSRCPQIVQDALLSILSERKIHIPELSGDDSVVYAREGFNLIATSNSLDRGLFDMSAALKRRLNFETIPPIAKIEDELDIVQREAKKLTRQSGIDIELDTQTTEMLVTIFHELRNGQTVSGRSTDRLAAAVMSTAEAVAVAHALCVYAFYYREGKIEKRDLLNFLVGASIKDNPQDRRRVLHYFDTEVATKPGKHWQELYQHRKVLVE